MIFGHNFETSVIVISYIQDKKYYKWLNHFLKSYRLNVNHSTMYLKKYIQFDDLEKIHFDQHFLKNGILLPSQCARRNLNKKS